jgi:hypothetical protein
MMFVLPETLCGASSEAGSWESRLRYREMFSGAGALFAAGPSLQLDQGSGGSASAFPGKRNRDVSLRLAGNADKAVT